MPRSLPEWVGKTDDTPIPPRVRLRVFERGGGVCYVCNRKIMTGEDWQVDHCLSLILGGENKESNLKVICRLCHFGKTANEIALKSKTYRTKAKHAGIKRRRGRPMPGTRGSGIRKRMSGEVWRE